MATLRKETALNDGEAGNIRNRVCTLDSYSGPTKTNFLTHCTRIMDYSVMFRTNKKTLSSASPIIAVCTADIPVSKVDIAKLWTTLFDTIIPRRIKFGVLYVLIINNTFLIRVTGCVPFYFDCRWSSMSRLYLDTSRQFSALPEIRSQNHASDWFMNSILFAYDATTDPRLVGTGPSTACALSPEK